MGKLIIRIRLVSVLIVLMNDQKGSFAFSQLDIGTAFTVYVNGEKISMAGVAGKNFESTIPDFFSEVSDFMSEAIYFRPRILCKDSPSGRPAKGSARGNNFQQ